MSLTPSKKLHKDKWNVVVNPDPTVLYGPLPELKKKRWIPIQKTPGPTRPPQDQSLLPLGQHIFASAQHRNHRILRTKVDSKSPGPQLAQYSARERADMAAAKAGVTPNAAYGNQGSVKYSRN